MTITCEHCGKPRDARVKGQRFCSDRCRMADWMAKHPRKGRKPKRIRSRKRESLQRMITKKTPLFRLKMLSDGYEPIELADRFKSWVCGMILRGNK